jgi:cytochrome P450
MAGTELPANAISFATYHLALNPPITAKLRSELAQFLHHKDGIPSLSELEKLPYLTAIIKESLRLSSLIPGRLPRVVPPEGITVSGLKIPGNMVVSSSALMVHTNPLLFPEPEKFVPERWMNSGNGMLDKFLVPFSVGRRDCIGQHLALAEMRMFISRLVVNWDFELVSENGEGKGTRWRDNIVACYEPAVRVKIWERREGHPSGEDKEAQG